MSFKAITFTNISVEVEVIFNGIRKVGGWSKILQVHSPYDNY